MILAWTVLALFALGAIGYFHGLAALERIRTQARADAVALATTEAFRAYGMNARCGENGPDEAATFVDEIYTFNGGLNPFICPAAEESPDGNWTRYGFSDAQVGQINGEFGKWTVEADVPMQSRTMRIYEGVTTYQDYIPIYPIVELVLDYSDSMDDEIAGGGKRLTELREALGEFLNPATGANNAEVGATFFATDTIRPNGGDVPIRLLTGPQRGRIRRAVDRTELRLNEVTGKTNYRAGLKAAEEKIKAKEDMGGRRIILLVSDGKPTIPQPDEAAASRAVDLARRIKGRDNVDDIHGLLTAPDEDGERAAAEAIMRDIVTDPDRDLVTDNRPGAYRAFFQNYRFFYTCRLRFPVEDVLDHEFPPHEVKVWMHRRGDPGPGIPMEFVDWDPDATDPEGDSYDVISIAGHDAAGEPIEVYDKYRYSIYIPADVEDEEGDVRYLTISQGACEQLRDPAYEIVIRSGHTVMASVDAEL